MDDTTTKILATARRATGLTAAGFDYSLTTGSDSQARAAIADACYHHANRHLPTVTAATSSDDLEQRRQRGRDLHARLWPQIERLIAEAKTTTYAGWSDASRGPIRYAR